MNEVELAAILCALLGGTPEASHSFDVDAGDYSVRVDCETATEVIEVGLDGKPSSRDSVTQTVFAAELTGKSPRVIMIDRDGVEDSMEYQVRVVSEKLDVPYVVHDIDALIRWQMTAYFRDQQAAAAEGPDS